MATAVASRFAVLCDDVEDDYSNRKRRPQPAKKPEAAKPAAAANTKAATNKKKKNKENTQTQTAKTKPKAEPAVTAKKKKEATPEQWEEWKEKDAQIVDVHYKDDLTQAILLSKLDFEKKKDLYKQAAKEVELKPPEPVEKKVGGKKNKKSIKVLSVEEFHNLGKVKSREDSPSTIEEPPTDDPEFFTRLQAEVKTELTKEKAPPKKAGKVREPFNEEALTLAKVRDALDKKIVEVEELKEENNTLKEELKDVKTRNKKLCHILANGEMKDKAEVLMEVERLQNVRDELSEQVASLHVQLEQERSKVRAVTNDSKTKDKNKKRTTSSGDQ